MFKNKFFFQKNFVLFIKRSFFQKGFFGQVDAFNILVVRFMCLDALFGFRVSALSYIINFYNLNTNTIQFF